MSTAGVVVCDRTLRINNFGKRKGEREVKYQAWNLRDTRNCRCCNLEHKKNVLVELSGLGNICGGNGYLTFQTDGEGERMLEKGGGGRAKPSK